MLARHELEEIRTGNLDLDLAFEPKMKELPTASDPATKPAPRPHALFEYPRTALTSWQGNASAPTPLLRQSAHWKFSGVNMVPIIYKI